MTRGITGECGGTLWLERSRVHASPPKLVRGGREATLADSGVAARTTTDATRCSSVGDLAHCPRRAHKPLVAFRLGEALIAWLRASAEHSGRSMTALVRDLLEDARSIYGLPGPVVEQLEADAASLGLDLRGYVRHVLFRRFEQLKEQGVSSAAPIGNDVPLRTEQRTAVQLRVR